MKVCNFDLRLHSLVTFGSGCGRGEIVRLKPDLLRADAPHTGAGWSGM